MSGVAGEKYARLRPADLLVDSYQRPFNPSRSKLNAETFDPDLFGMGTVSLRRNGKYYIIDGQHRCRYAQLAGYGEREFLFRVYVGLTFEGESALFTKLNDGAVKPNAMQMFVGNEKAGESRHVHIVRILKSLGLSIGTGLSDGTVSSVSVLLDVYDNKFLGLPTKLAKARTYPPGQILSRTLNVLRDAWGSERAAYEGILIRGVASVLVKHGANVDQKTLSKALGKQAPAVVLRSIKGITTLSNRKPAVAAIETIEDVHDKNKSRGNRLNKIEQ